MYLSKSYSTRLQNGEVVLVSFGMIDHIMDKKSLYLQSPQSLTIGKCEAGIEPGIEVWRNEDQIPQNLDENEEALE